MNPHVAILLTNQDDSAFAKAYPDDAQKVIHLLQPLRPHWRFSVVRVADGMLPDSIHTFDGYVITGSPASVNDESLPWVAPLLAFIRALHAGQRPLIGLCFGHQAIAKALGGTVERHRAGWGLGLSTTRWDAAAAAGTPAWMAPPRDRMSLLAAHNEQVSVLPAGARLLSASPFCRHAAFSLGRHILTTQFHPEMSLQFMQALLGHLDTLAGRGEGIDPETLGAARRSLVGLIPQGDGLLQDAQVFAQWMVQFMEGAT